MIILALDDCVAATGSYAALEAETGNFLCQGLEVLATCGCHSSTNTEQMLSCRKAQTMTAREKDADPAEMMMTGQNNFKVARMKPLMASAGAEDDH